MNLKSELDSNPDAVEMARRDLRERTLKRILMPLERLVYLASLRDYRNGRYKHDGLALHFSEQVAAKALRLEHIEAFRIVAFASLQSVVSQLDNFLSAVNEERAECLVTWRTLEPYRVVVPVVEDRLSTLVFLSNIKLALAILTT